MLRPLAKANLSLGGGDKKSQKAKESPSAKLPNPIDTRAQSAKTAGVGERTYDANQRLNARQLVGYDFRAVSVQGFSLAQSGVGWNAPSATVQTDRTPMIQHCAKKV